MIEMFPSNSVTTIQKEADMALDTTTTTAAATASSYSTIFMHMDTFRSWIREAQGNAVDAHNCIDEKYYADFRMETENDPHSPFIEILGYRGTANGTVIAFMRKDSPEVEVLLDFKAGADLKNTVNLMLAASNSI